MPDKVDLNPRQLAFSDALSGLIGMLEPGERVGTFAELAAILLSEPVTLWGPIHNLAVDGRVRVAADGTVFVAAGIEARA